MSKAFTKEDGAQEAGVVAPRAPLPAGVPNYVTPHGLEQLRAERRELEAAREALREASGGEERRAALAARLLELDRRLASAQCVEPEPSAQVVRFGSHVTLRDAAGREQRYQIVGVDEADPALGKIGFVSPLAKALLGAEVGDTVQVQRPGGTRSFELVAIE